MRKEIIEVLLELAAAASIFAFLLGLYVILAAFM